MLHLSTRRFCSDSRDQLTSHDSSVGGHPDGCRLNEFFEGPPLCVGVSVDHHARLPNECRCKTVAATQSFRVRFKIMVANWTPPAHARLSRTYDLHRNTKDRHS